MSEPVTIPFDAGQARLNWLSLTDALMAGHKLPKAEVSDSLLQRGDDTLLNRSAWIDGLGQAVKVATIFPGNTALEQPSINGVVALFDDQVGTLAAIIDFHLVTKWKTAGDSLLAARHLARADSETILIVGAGTVAASLLEAYAALFPEARFLLWNRSKDRAEALAQRCPTAEVCAELKSAVQEADIICCATMSTTPLLEGSWLKPGQHIDLIGAYRPDMREADDETMRRGRLFVDSRDSTLAHIGELREPLAAGVIEESDVLADFYALERFTRKPEDITVFKNGGGAHLDLMTCRYILERWQTT